ncbi:hypothetical protein [Methylobacterium sp. Leaf108]|uniref:hypothetical protein n=1 Tax=Methylobacterium sp. Leaf108 TaxID=1736256 RepID=UPI0006F67F07|nr:hypothetical protein [Methylobacterium sp. Leaf108]KQP52581.1 hypothetical protein ASF39_06595 [Methylobacterium sp. Leaf108]
MNGDSLNRLRQAFTPIMLGVLAALWLVVMALAWSLGTAIVAPTVLGGLLVAGSAACARSLGPALATRHLTSAALMAMVGLLVLTTADTPWQIDTHMVFFAALAIVAGWGCWASILVAAAVVAVHHLALNVAYPAAVFPNGADYLRVLLHAVVVIAEAGALVLAARQLSRALDAADAATLQASESAAAQSRFEQAALREHALQASQGRQLGDLVAGFRATLSDIGRQVERETSGMRNTAVALSDVAARSSEQASQSASIASTTAQNVLSVSAGA